MTRARATALVLVNWKGVFYERYLLDRHVTSLEGANGAGKTTVMIAAYVVLLPDMSRLRFTNLGETAATGGDRGIWGRLGEPGRPSYAALELELGAAQRVVLGVHLERRAEPAVEPKPFLVSELAPEARLQDLFLVKTDDADAVPDLDALRANAAALGAKIEVFRSTKEYFAELFERGISPLRLTTEEDKTKLNEMLRTSMTGGISRALTSELRTFLLREELGLSDALSRMRANLDTCRRTRTEVSEAQRSEREISAVFEAGQALLRLSLRASEREVREVAGSGRRAADERDRLIEELARHRNILEAATSREQSFTAEIEATTQRRAAAEAERQRTLAASAAAGRIQELSEERRKRADDLASASAAREEASRLREHARAARTRAQTALANAAAGLSALEAGLEELHRRAHAHRAFMEHLGAARRLLGAPELDADAAVIELPALRARIAELDTESARRAREVETAASRRAEFDRAFALLARLSPEATHETAFELAQNELARARELETASLRLEELEREHEQRLKLSARRKAVIERAAALDVHLGGEDAEQALSNAWSAAERELTELEQKLQEEELAQRDRRTREHALLQRGNALADVCVRLAEHQERLSRLAAALGEESLDRAGLERARARLAREGERLREKASSLSADRQRALALAGRLEATRGAVPPELLRLADEVDAQLSSDRFDDLEPEAAAHIEAALGPLAQALVVEDPVSAARALSALPRAMNDVHLVSADQLENLVARARELPVVGADVLVEAGGAVRVVRKPESPRLGRRARAAEAKQLRAQADALEAEIDGAREGARQHEEWLRDVERALVEGGPLAELDAPAELRAAESELERVRLELGEAAARLQDLRGRGRELRERVLSLRRLVAEGHVLGQGAEIAEELAPRLSRARSARDELESVRDVARELGRALDALRAPPPPLDAIERWRSDSLELHAERDRLFQAASALEAALPLRAAAAFGEAEHALATEASVVPSLRAEHEHSARELERAEAALLSAEARFDEAVRVDQSAHAELSALDAVVERERAALAALGGHAGGSAGGEAALVETVEELDRRLELLRRDERAAARETALAGERLSRVESALEAAEKAVRAADGVVRPKEEQFRELQRRAHALGVSATAIGETALDSRSSNELWAETRGKAELLLDRLGRARSGERAALEIRERLAAEVQDARVYLDVWLAVREWVLRCLPASIAEASDPNVAVAGLRRHLLVLEERLERQEHDLRGTSEDVARSIEVQIRRAQSQVRRLNQHLTGVYFGSIRGIRIRIGRVERMDQILRALREGATQGLLFEAGLPIEEALNEIFRRHGGGKGGGQRLLDYREYLDLGVEIRRQEDGQFEPANPTRLSTGEAIGVGAALMMVVLTEWERDANLLRGKRPVQSLRFLFLDEANRLSQDNLGVLFDLCRNLDLQLLIAAPEVARAEGNTTYRLVRQKTADGRDEVIVSGRRAIARAETTASVLADPPNSPAE